MTANAVEKSTGHLNPTSKTDVGQLWRKLFIRALNQHASVMHLEIREDNAQVRLRQNGRLASPINVPLATSHSLIEYLKQLAKLETKRGQAPQSGTFIEKYRQQTIACRLFSLPILNGESMVIHLTDKSAEPPPLAALGLWGKGLHRLQASLSNSSGLIILSGPRHSGVSTTLASCGLALASPPHQLASVEEDSPYHLPNTNYMKVQPLIGMSWARVLRLQLRRQPNSVLLGNVADRQTAVTVLEASRQHLLLAGTRADSALIALNQWCLLSDDRLSLATHLSLISAQRLVPQLCAHCRQVYIPNSDLQEKLTNHFRLTEAKTTAFLNKLLAEAETEQLGGEGAVSQTALGPHGFVKQLWRSKPNGCRACDGRGYQGVIGLFEVREMTDELRAALSGLSANQTLPEVLHKPNTITLAADGLIKAIRGLIPIDAVLTLA